MSDLLSALPVGEAALRLGKESLSVFETIFKKVEAVKGRKLSAQNYLRAYYFEVVNNIELLNILNVRALEREKVNSENIRFLLSQLETDIGTTILFSEDTVENGTALFKFLKEKGRIKNVKNMLVSYVDGMEKPVAEKNYYENILQAISFTIVKIEVLRKLSLYSDSSLSMLNKVLLEKRLMNIRERFAMIKEKMDSLEGIAELAR